MAKRGLPSNSRKEEIIEEDSFEIPQPVPEKSAKVVLRRDVLNTSTYVVVKSNTTFVDSRSNSALRSCTAESQSSSIEAAVSTVIAMALDEQTEVIIMSELVTYASS